MSLAVIGFVLFLSPVNHESYQLAVMLHGLAALIELASEPLYCLASVRLRFRLRAAVDASAIIAKSALTLALVSFSEMPPALAFSFAQLAFSAVTLLLYAIFIGPEAMDGRRTSEGPLWGAREREVLWMSGLFSLQALEKQVLAEGSKMVLATVQSQYNQGVYGLVSNLGSLVVRTLFQPLEEIAFATFSRLQASVREGNDTSVKAKESLARLASILAVLVKTVLLLGLFSASFGPSFSYTLIKIVYGSRWSETEAPTVLACYSIYIVLLAVNGVTEAFIHAVLDSKGLQQTNYLLVLFSAAHIAASVFCIRKFGASGLILADGVSMVIRISTSLFYIRLHFHRSLPSFSLKSLMLERASLLAFAATCITCRASEQVLLGSLRSPSLLLITHHIGVGFLCLCVMGGVILFSEKELVRQIRQGIVNKRD